MADHVYCINLARRPDRRLTAQEQFDREGLDVEFIEAIDGKELGIGPEQGCAWSHLSVWKDMADKGYGTALIFEDDCVLETNFKNKLHQILELFKEHEIDWDLINLGACGRWSIPNKEVAPGIFEGRSACFQGYIISNRWAENNKTWSPKRMGKAIEEIEAPNMYWINESIVVQNNHFDSNIGIDRSFVKKIALVVGLILLFVILLMYIKR